MNKITPIKLGSRGKTVANLHQALQFLIEHEIFQINEQFVEYYSKEFEIEIESRVFSEVTSKLIQAIQIQYNLTPNGIVDEATADLINGFLVEFGALSQNRLPDKDKVKEFWQKLVIELQQDGFLQELIALYFHAFGNMSIEDFLDSNPAELAQKANLPNNGFGFEIMPDDINDILQIARRLYAETQEENDIPEKPVSPIEVDPFYLIKGKITNEKGAGIAGLFVYVYNMGVPGDYNKKTILTKPVHTEEDGSCIVKIPFAKLKSKLKKQPDIIIKITDKSGKELNQTKYYNLQTITKVNIVISSNIYVENSEFDKLNEIIMNHLPRTYKITDIKEDDYNEEITYLARKTKWDARLVAMSALAHRYAQEEKIPAEFYYVLFRAGIPSDENLLYRTNVDKAIELFETAINKNIVPDIKLDIHHIKKVFQSKVLHSKSPMSVSTMDEMLSLSLSNSKDKEAFMSHYLSGSSLDETLDKMKGQIDSKVVQNIKLDGKLGYLSFNNVSLIKNIKEEHNLEDPLELVKNGFYKEDKWNQYIDDGMIPDVFEGETTDAKRSNYKQWMTTQLKLSYPTAVVAEKIINSEMTINASASVKEKVYVALYSNNFTLGDKSINQHISDLKITDKQVIRELQRIHRAYQLSPSDDVMNILLTENLDSAFKITKFTKEEFINNKSFATKKEAELVYEKALADASLITNVTMSYLTQAVNPLPAAVAPMIHNSPAAPVKKYPKLEELFGNLDFCTCGHCESVLSPAAYLADLLHFIDPNPISALLERRPDIEYMELSCENTMTVLPYIDLVNEIMEYYVVNESLISFEGHNTTEAMKSSELLAEPANVESEAYNMLKNEVYPLSVPFNYFLEYTRAFFNKMGSPFYEVLETMRKDESFALANGYGWRDIFCEQLHISPELYGIFTDTTEHSIKKLYGLKDIDVLNTILSNAKKFTQVTDIQYNELVSLLKTEFMNPSNRRNNDEMIILNKENNVRNCDFEEYRLSYFNGKELEDIEYWKFIRFIRFWKHFGWNIEKTDKIIEVLTKLSSEIDAESDTSQKEKILDNGFHDLIVRLAILERVQKELGSEGNETFDMLLELWKYIGSNTSEAEKENGYKLLARVLQIGIEEIHAIKVLSGINPLESFYYLDGENYKEPNILAFVTIAQKIKESDFSVTELNYLFRNIDTNGEASPKDEEYYGLFKTLSSVLQEIDKQYSIDDEDEISREKALELLTAVYGKEDADIMQSIFSDTKVFTTAYSHTSDTLDTDIINVDSRIAYDDLKKELSFKGMINSVIRDAFKAVLGVSDTFKVAIDELHFLGMAGLSTTKVFTTDYTHSTDTLETGITAIDPRLSYDHANKKLSFYGKMSVELQTNFKNVSRVSRDFKNAIDGLYDDGEKTYKSFFVSYPEFEEIRNKHKSLREIISATLPSLVKRLKDSYIQQSLSAQLKFETDIIGLLLKSKIDGTYLLNSSVKTDIPMINDFIALESQGIVAPVDKKCQFYLAPEVSSNYNLYFDVLDMPSSPSNYKLFIDGEEINIKRSNDILENQDPILFEAGKIYKIKINAEKFKPEVSLKWKQGDRLRETIPKRLLISCEVMQSFKHSYTRLLKVLQLIKGLNLSVESIEYLSHQHGASFVKNIPYNDSIRLSHTQMLFTLFLGIMKYNTLNNQLKIKDDSLIQFFEAPKETFKVEDKVRSIFYHVVDWNKEDLDAIVKHFKDDVTLTDTEAELVDIALLSKTTRVFELLKSLGIAATDLISCSTPYISNTDIAKIFQTRYDKEAWLKISQKINDKMRRSQRDALVSYILNTLSKKEKTKHIDTADKLFEYFLIDVQMDSCMKTSRIKQAISSVQLFVDRCLYNLEADISPTSIDAEQWEWMKRYRVWEANRKVFLHPENWLDPSLRTTKSPFFKEFEGEMLQSDINDDLATKALLNYLEKVDQVSQLEICGMCREKEDDNKSTIHVIGRTAGMRREYYHRRYDGTWSAWEKITVDVEDGPVIPVYWKGRLFLFWTTTLQKGQTQEVSNNDVSENLKNIQGSPKFNIEVNLCWSEYYNSKWQAKRTTDFNEPIIIKNVEDSFNRNDIELEYININVEKSNLTHLNISILKEGNCYGSFTFYNMQSLPSKTDGESPKFSRLIINNKDQLVFKNNKNIYMSTSVDIILNNYFYRAIDFAHPIHYIYNAPFFLNDNKYSFFVDVDKSKRSFQNTNTFGSDVLEKIDPKQDWNVLANDTAFNFMGINIGHDGKIDKARKIL